MTIALERSAVTVAELVRALREERAQAPATDRTPTAAPRDATTPLAEQLPRFTVVGAHPGAGASTVALALAESVAQIIGGCLLVDHAPPHASGLCYAADHELGQRGGWLVGRRGGVEIRRPAADPDDNLPVAGTGTGVDGSQHGALVFDAGVLEAPNRSRGNESVNGGAVVLLCRASCPGLRRAEHALTTLPTCTVVVAVGARRLPPPVRLSLGTACAAADADGRLRLVPAARQVAMHGITPDPLPARLRRAVAPLAADLLTTTPPAPSPTTAPRR